MSNQIPSPRILLGPGPSSVSEGVLKALGTAPIGYLDPDLFRILDTIRTDLRSLFGTSNGFTLPLTGTGMAGMECCLANLIEPGDLVIIGVAGFFGGRMVEIARRLSAEVIEIQGEWGKILEPEAFETALKSLPHGKKVKLVGCVHAETSTGIHQPVREIADIVHRYGAIFLADTVTSLGGLPVDIDTNGVDVSYSGTQKCVGAPPGLSPITVSASALEISKSRTSACTSWFFDWSLLEGYYDGAHAYHHTVPVNLYYALSAALREAHEEGLLNRYQRHRDVSRLLMDGLEDLGIVPFAQEGHRLPTLNAVIIPDRVSDEMAVRKRLLTEYGIEIGGGLGSLKGRIWRIGTMGASATTRNVTLLLAALKAIL